MGAGSEVSAGVSDGSSFASSLLWLVAFEADVSSLQAMKKSSRSSRGQIRSRTSFTRRKCQICGGKGWNHGTSNLGLLTRNGCLRCLGRGFIR